MQASSMWFCRLSCPKTPVHLPMKNYSITPILLMDNARTPSAIEYILIQPFDWDFGFRIAD